MTRVYTIPTNTIWRQIRNNDFFFRLHQKGNVKHLRDKMFTIYGRLPRNSILRFPRLIHVLPDFRQKNIKMFVTTIRHDQIGIKYRLNNLNSVTKLP